MITEIKEKDFRKLDLKVWQFNLEKRKYEKVSLNNILDNEIKGRIENGYEEDEFVLSCPVTIAIHKDNNKKNWEDGEYYLDKFMDMYTGAATYEMGMGIKHLYSNRDYYQCNEDYWRVRKDETDVVYRVHLEKKEFVLKHKSVQNDDIIIYYDLIGSEWVESRRVKLIRHEGCIEYISVP